MCKDSEVNCRQVSISRQAGGGGKGGGRLAGEPLSQVW